MAVPITESDLAKFQKHMTDNAPDAACLMCRETKLDVLGVEVTANFSDGTAYFTGNVIPTVAVVCPRCKFVMRFACKGIF
jgi:hypothetical protein